MSRYWEVKLVHQYGVLTQPFWATDLPDAMRMATEHHQINALIKHATHIEITETQPGDIPLRS